MIFFLDTNIFVEGKKHSYAPDICLAFWEWLCEEGSDGNIRSISNVLEEIDVGCDDLQKWARKMLPADFFIKTDKDNEVVEERRRMQDALVSSGEWDGSKLQSFLSGADLWLIATAKVKGGCVVTNEYVNPKQRRIKIPLVAQKFGVLCCTIYDVMRSMGIRLSSYDRNGKKRNLVAGEGRFVVQHSPSFSDVFPLDS